MPKTGRSTADFYQNWVHFVNKNNLNWDFLGCSSCQGVIGTKIRIVALLVHIICQIPFIWTPCSHTHFFPCSSWWQASLLHWQSNVLGIRVAYLSCFEWRYICRQCLFAKWNLVCLSIFSNFLILWIFVILVNFDIFSDFCNFAVFVNFFNLVNSVIFDIFSEFCNLIFLRIFVNLWGLWFLFI